MNKIKAIKFDDKTIIIQNKSRIDEDVLFKNLKNKLLQNPNITFANKITGPSENVYHGKINSLDFALIYDLNDGVSIVSENPESLKQLTEYLD
mgnify:CR=1 FL=1